MATEYSTTELLDFLSHASERGLLPGATAQALGVACRNVFEILDETEAVDVRRIDVANTFKRFANKRAKEFNPSSLKEYQRRVGRAIDLFIAWRGDPANFKVKTRATQPRKRALPTSYIADATLPSAPSESAADAVFSSSVTYQSSFPIRPGMIVTLSGIPKDLSPTEADRLAQFVKLLALS